MAGICTCIIPRGGIPVQESLLHFLQFLGVGIAFEVQKMFLGEVAS